MKNDNKRKYLQQENKKYCKDCFGNKRRKFALENSVISCNMKSRIKVPQHAMHQG